MPGITRIVITDPINGQGAWRFKDSKRLYPTANKLYRQIFEQMGMPLQPGEEERQCTRQEFIAGYDYALGIDVILTFVNDQSATLQEKFLFTTFNTVTVEYMQDWRNDIRGDWFNMKCQYYFVGYDRTKSGKFDKWVLLDWSRTMVATAQNRLKWGIRNNGRDGARASLKFCEMNEIPDDCITTCSWHILQNQLVLDRQLSF